GMAVGSGAVVVLSLLGAPGAGAGRAPTVLPEVPVTPVDLAQDTANNSPALAVDPTDARFVALASRVDNPVFSCRLHLSGDGGRSWVPADPVPRLPAGAERCYAPEVGFDSRGVLYYLFAGLAGRGNRPVGVYLVTSSNQGRRFSAPRKLLGPNVYQVRMAIDRGRSGHDRIHMVWLAPAGPPSLGGLPATPNPIVTSHSDDGGRSFSRPVPVSDPERARVVAPALAVGPDHAVHVLYYDLGRDAVDYQGLEGPTWGETWSLVVSSSTDGGGSFSRGVVVDDAVVPPERVLLIFTMPPPALVAGPGRLYAAWHDGRNGDWDVFLRASADGGSTWAPTVRLNDDPSGDGRHQYLPRLGMA
ncbi:MAG: sialidase family protein, partial [Acidimicrobiales bacterium]